MLKAWLSRTLGLETRAATLASPSASLMALFGSLPTIAGANVSPLSAMRCAPVRRCVNVISETLATLPAGVVEIASDGSRKPVAGHPLNRLLTVAANPWTPPGRLIEQAARDALLHGNSFVFVNRVGGEVRELVRLPPEAVQVTYQIETGEPFYRVTNGEDQRDLPREDVLHIAAASIDGVVGLSPVIEAREAIGLCLIMEAHAARLFAKGARPAGVLSFAKSLGDAAAARLAASWKALNSGENAGGVAIVEEGGSFVPLAFSSVDAQFVELWQRATHEVCRAFGVPPSMAFEMDRATWANSSEMNGHFLRYTLARWITAFEAEMRLKLLSEDERANHEISFDSDLLLRNDLEARSAAYAQLRAAGVVTSNEIRSWENLPPRPDGDTLQNPNTTSGKAQTTGADQ